MLYHQTLVGTVCGDQLDDTAAAVICNRVGYEHLLFWLDNRGSGISPWGIQDSYNILLSDIECSCFNSKYANCVDNHFYDVFLACDTAPAGTGIGKLLLRI